MSIDTHTHTHSNKKWDPECLCFAVCCLVEKGLIRGFKQSNEMLLPQQIPSNFEAHTPIKLSIKSNKRDGEGVREGEKSTITYKLSSTSTDPIWNFQNAHTHRHTQMRRQMTTMSSNFHCGNFTHSHRILNLFALIWIDLMRARGTIFRILCVQVRQPKIIVSWQIVPPFFPSFRTPTAAGALFIDMFYLVQFYFYSVLV